MNRRNLGLLVAVAGLASAFVSTVILLRPVTNTWGQECGSVLAPKEFVALTELTSVLEEAAFESACPEEWSPLIAWGSGAAALAGVLLAVGLYLYWVVPKKLTKRPAHNMRQLSEELERIQALHKMGSLTDSEYSSAKSKLLDQ